MRRFITASHHYLAYGLKDTLQFLTARDDIIDISAYVDEDVELTEQIQKVFSQFGAEDEVVIMTDMLGGSVNQKFVPYISERVHLISGINLPCAMSLVLMPEDMPLTEDMIEDIVAESREQLIYVNRVNFGQDDSDDE